MRNGPSFLEEVLLLSILGSTPPVRQLRLVIAIFAMIAAPAAITLHTAKVLPAEAAHDLAQSSPLGYTWSLLLFVVPIGTIAFWLVPQDGVAISKKSFLWTIGLLVPAGFALDYFFAASFLTFPNTWAVSGIHGPTLHGWVPIEEYVFYLTGFVAVLLIYIWLDEYWLAAYSIPSESDQRKQFDRLLKFHPQSLVWAAVLIGGACIYKFLILHQAGFPGYFTFLVLGALLPSALLLPEALPMINWRAFAMTLFLILLISLLWEATMAMPYQWWGYNHTHMMGVYITGWTNLPIEAVCVWVAVTFETTIVYEIIRRWQASKKPAKRAFLGDHRTVT